VPAVPWRTPSSRQWRGPQRVVCWARPLRVVPGPPPAPPDPPRVAPGRRRLHWDRPDGSMPRRTTSPTFAHRLYGGCTREPGADTLSGEPDCSHRRCQRRGGAQRAGLQGVVGQMPVALRNRVEVDRYVADHREIETGSLPSPIFLTGLPRSGTTYFQYLFDEDPGLRVLCTWEGDRPVPPPALDAGSVRRRRAESTEHGRLAREATAASSTPCT